MKNTEHRNVRIVTDSAVCLPQNLIEEYGIRIVPEIIAFGTREYQDRKDITAREFYDLLAKADEIPTTSAPSPADFLHAFQEVAEEADSIVCILVTSGFSSMGYEAATKAKSMLPELSIDIIDSRTAVGAYGFIALAAAKAAAEGRSRKDVSAAAESMKRRVNVVATLNTMKYLAKGGRVGKAAHWATSLLDIKPVISVPTSTGVLEPIGRIRTRKKALRRLLDTVGESVGPEDILHASVDHACVPEEATWLKSQLERRFSCTDVLINDWAPVAGAHCGPGVIGISYYTGE